MPFLNRLFSAIARLWRAQETLSVKNVRLGHLHYLLAFPLSMVFALRRPVLLDSQLAVNGRDLMAAGIPAGPALRRVLEALLDGVIRAEYPNEKPVLLAAAQKIIAS